MDLLSWGVAVFRSDANSSADPSLWSEKLAEAQAGAAAYTDLEDPLEIKVAGFGPDYVAAICVRDHWDELSEEQRTWCANRICEAVIADAETRDDPVIAARNPLDGSRPAAFVISALFSKELPSILRDRSTNALAIALTHPVGEIVEYAAQGVGTFLWDADRDLALTCVGALAQQARDHGTFLRERRAHSRFDPPAEERFLVQLKQNTRSQIKSRSSFSDQTLLGLNLGERPAQVALPLLLTMLTAHPEEPLARSFLVLLVQQIAVAWTHAEERGQDRRHRRNREDFLDPDWVPGLHEFVASFALRLSLEAALALVEPILAAIPRHPREVAEFVDCLIIAEDARFSGEVFWTLWQAATDRFLTSDLPASVEMEHSGARKLLGTLFFNNNWKDTARE
jgi:hypothetical protein